MIQYQTPAHRRNAAQTLSSPHRPTPRQLATELLLIADRLCRLRRQRRQNVHDRQQLRAIRRELRSLLRGHAA